MNLGWEFIRRQRVPSQRIADFWQRFVDLIVDRYSRIRFRQRLFYNLGELLKLIPESQRELAKKVWPPQSGYHLTQRPSKGVGRAGVARGAASGSSSSSVPAVSAVPAEVDVHRRHNKISINITNSMNNPVPAEQGKGNSGRHVVFVDEDPQLWPPMPPRQDPPEWRPRWNPSPEGPEAQADYVRQQAWRVAPPATGWTPQASRNIPRWDPEDCDWGSEHSC